jgi:hypothetical protein
MISVLPVCASHGVSVRQGMKNHCGVGTSERAFIDCEIPCMPTTRATRATPTRLHARRADPVLDWSKLTRDQAAALIEVTSKTFSTGAARTHARFAESTSSSPTRSTRSSCSESITGFTWNGTCMTSATASPSAWRPRWRGWTAAHGAPAASGRIIGRLALGLRAGHYERASGLRPDDAACVPMSREARRARRLYSRHPNLLSVSASLLSLALPCVAPRSTSVLPVGPPCVPPRSASAPSSGLSCVPVHSWGGRT